MHKIPVILAIKDHRLSWHNATRKSALIGQRFGVEESLVLKRMKLARVAPQLLKEYRSDGITLECLMAFTVTDDHRRQLKVFRSLQDWQKDDPSAIRAALTEKMIEASSKPARFVGLNAYVAAGGAIEAFRDAKPLLLPSKQIAMLECG